MYHWLHKVKDKLLYWLRDSCCSYVAIWSGLVVWTWKCWILPSLLHSVNIFLLLSRENTSLLIEAYQRCLECSKLDEGEKIYIFLFFFLFPELTDLPSLSNFLSVSNLSCFFGLPQLPLGNNPIFLVTYLFQFTLSVLDSIIVNSVTCPLLWFGIWLPINVRSPLWWNTLMKVTCDWGQGTLCSYLVAAAYLCVFRKVFHCSLLFFFFKFDTSGELLTIVVPEADREQVLFLLQ